MSQSIKQSLLILTLCVIPAVSNASQSCGQLTDTHFIDNNDGTVSDPLTGLMWKKCIENNSWDSATSSCVVDPSTSVGLTWHDALVKAAEVNAGTNGYQNFGKTNWRVPNIKELVTLADLNCSEPAVNIGLFPILTASPVGTDVEFWSSTHTNFISNLRLTSAYTLALKYRIELNSKYKNSQRILVRLVRDDN